MDSGEQHIERIIRQGDSDVLTSFPIYTKWLIANTHYTIKPCGVVGASKEGAWVIDDVVLPGINSPLPKGRKFKTGQEEPKRRRRRRKRKVNEDGDMMTEEEQLLEEAR